MKKVSKEVIESFLAGNDPMEHIIKIECDYNDEYVYIIYIDNKGVKRIKKDFFHPFVWCKQKTARELFNGKRNELKRMMSLYGIGVKGLKINSDDKPSSSRMENGYRILFYAKSNMTFTHFLSFFEKGGLPVYPKQKDKNYGQKDYICVAPNEQYMIATGKRLFKGYNDYDELTRMSWDLETEGLDPTINAIDQIGIRTNKGFEKIIKVDHEDKYGEIKALIDFRDTIKELKPDIITGHNTENFDWNFVNVRLEKYNSDLLKFTQDSFPKGIFKKKKQSVLKLGGEMEYYYPTCMWGTHITDSLFAVRRAQALDSNMKKADLKYVTKYSKLNKPNRVYVPGKLINKTWSDKENKYAFNDINGQWFKITDSNISKFEKIADNSIKDIETQETYEIVSGEYIVQRYLLDDLYETDKVELQYNQSNFLVGKMLPVSFEKMCTMGTAAIWKYIMLAWSYENDLAIPELIQSRSFTGGLSRLLSVGFIDRVVKLDYNSLYPSIILSMGIESGIDISGVMSSLLEYILTQREYYKELKAKFGSMAKQTKKLLPNETDEKNIKELKNKIAKYEMEAARNDKMQLPLKITGNAYFGSYGSGSVFPWSDIECAEETTCSGRQMLRLMIYWFTNKGYKPIVGDSFTADTPVFIKYKENGFIDIQPVSAIIDEDSINVDMFNREYDYSEKPYQILCRSGWCDISYIYRHKTDKTIYTIKDNNTLIDVTEDHSLFDNEKNKISPNTISESTKLEYYNINNIQNLVQTNKLEVCKINEYVNIALETNKVPIEILNSNKDYMESFYWIAKHKIKNSKYNTSKTFKAGMLYIENRLF